MYIICSLKRKLLVTVTSLSAITDIFENNKGEKENSRKMFTSPDFQPPLFTTTSLQTTSHPTSNQNKK